MSNHIKDKLDSIATAVEDLNVNGHDDVFGFNMNSNLGNIGLELNKLNENILELIAVIKSK